jgi:hypothetical protein
MKNKIEKKGLLMFEFLYVVHYIILAGIPHCLSGNL